MKLFAFISFLSLAHALSKNEIENIRKELNAELTQLEDENTKRANNQVASVVKSDQDAEIDALLRQLTKKEKADGSKDILRQINLDKKDSSKNDLWITMEKAKIDRDEANSKRSTLDKEKAKELLEHHFDKTGKRSQDNQAAASLDALSKLLMNEEKKSEKREVVSDFGRYIPPEKCNDQRSDCHTYKEYCETPEYRLMMRERCPFTCGACMKCLPDKWPAKYCKRIVKLAMCNVDRFKDRIRENCFDSCGFCRANAPPACSFDPEGCCWDGKRFAKDGCRNCADNKQIKNICERLKMECTNKYSPGKYMKEHCPVTCGFCNPKKECHDTFRFRKECKTWAAKGECEVGATKSICPRSCNACADQKNQ
ncbi:uncharacterized protein [Clytia hemisphaerica]|uniref:ShKT domain-containing protein n=1 Tax=Clytia hemisphaerica TaxID=252671 RepID=A0A7M5TT88_9CNID